jgi:hypothetical protein
LCNLAPQGALTPKGSVQAGGGKGTDRAGSGTGRSSTSSCTKTQIPIIEQAIETAPMTLATDTSRGYWQQWRPIDASSVNVAILQVPSRRTKAGFSPGIDREYVVNRTPPNRPRLRLDPELYERLREQVLRRDGWRWQSCEARSNLEVHHNEFGSRGGSDCEENLITLCVGCHSLVHRLKCRAGAAK